jgi:predicted GNAT family acetyltransferase
MYNVTLKDFLPTDQEVLKIKQKQYNLSLLGMGRLVLQREISITKAWQQRGEELVKLKNKIHQTNLKEEFDWVKKLNENFQSLAKKLNNTTLKVYTVQEIETILQTGITTAAAKELVYVLLCKEIGK